MFEFIILVSVGLLLLCLGTLIWKKEKIDLIHNYHHKKVKKEDCKKYTNSMGKGIIIIGIGTVVQGILYLFLPSVCWGYFIVCFLIGFIIIIRAQIIYNKGLF